MSTLGPAKTEAVFVLLPEPREPDVEAVLAAYRELAPGGPRLQLDVDEPEGEADAEGLGFEAKVTSLKVGDADQVMLTFVPVPVPNGEAEANASFSPSNWKNDDPFPSHHAQLVVVYKPGPGVEKIAGRKRFTMVLAAIAQATKAVGVYWGWATHRAAYFIDMAKSFGVPVPLWVGVDLIRESPTRISMLSSGMEDFGLPNLRVTAPVGSGNEAVGNLFDLLTYVLQRGSPLPEGDTVGNSPEQRLLVQYEPSPVVPGATIWRVDCP